MPEPIELTEEAGIEDALLSALLGGGTLKEKLQALSAVAAAAAQTANDAASAVVAAGGTLPGSTDLAPLYAAVLLDPLKKLLASWDKHDGAYRGKLSISVDPETGNGLTFTYDRLKRSYKIGLGTTAGQLPIGASKVEERYHPQYAAVFLDKNGKILSAVRKSGYMAASVPPELTADVEAAKAEVTTARGGQSSLNTRLSRSITPYGLPDGPTWGLHYLRETRQRLRLRALGEAGQLVVASIGDSWTHNAGRWSGPTASTLMDNYGDAGGGWSGLAWQGFTTLRNGNVRPVDYTTASTGSWTATYYTSPSPDLGHITSSTAGDVATFTGPASPVLSGAELCWIGTADGVARYRWNGGSWTSLNVQGSGLQHAALSGLPASGAWTLEVEVEAGTCSLAGVDFKSAADGVRWHKLGSTGSRGSQWAGVNATQWQSGLAALGPHLVTILLGTNDQAAYGAANFRTHLDTLIGRVRAAVPAADVLLISPAENQRTDNAEPMSAYQEQTYRAAYEHKCGFLNLQSFFGEDPADYAAGSSRPWFNADLIHPEPASGGRAIADAVIRSLVHSI